MSGFSFRTIETANIDERIPGPHDASERTSLKKTLEDSYLLFELKQR